MKVEVRVDQERCKACLLCTSVCPKQIFVQSQHTNSRGYPYMLADEGKDCIGCMQCVTICPDIAIELVKEE